MKNILSKRILRYILTGLHILLTFVWSGRVFMNIGIHPVGTLELDSPISLTFQTAVTHVFTELFAIVIIYCIWRLFFFLCENFKKEYLIFLALWIIGSVLILCSWPSVFGLDDNVVTYSFAVRLIPDYWHSFYHSVIYGAFLLVFPLDFMITLMQWSGFVFMTGFLFFKTEKAAGHAKWLVLLLYLMPNGWLMGTYGHRIMIYMILALIYITLISFNLTEKKETSDLSDILTGLFAAFLCVYRSEGILLGAPLYLIFLIFKKKKSLKDFLIKAALFVFFFAVLSLPQKMGEIRHYGNDYSIYNTCEPLKVILNDENADLNYKGAAEDLAAISAVVPADWIREYGITAYRITNFYVKGSPDINQTCSGDAGKIYMRAYSNICRHNLGIFIKNIYNNFIYAATGKAPFTMGVYTGEHHDIGWWEYPAFENSQKELLGNRHSAVIANMSDSLKVYDNFFAAIKESFEGLKKAGVYLAWLIVLTLFNAIIALYSLIKAIRNKKAEYLQSGLVSVFAVGLTLAIILVMPVVYSPYLIPGEYVMLFSAFTFLIRAFADRRKNPVDIRKAN